MARVKEVHFSLGIIARERFRSGRQKEWIIFSPDREQGRTILPKERLKLRIQRHIAGVVQEEVELDLVIAGPGEQCRVEGIALGSNERCIVSVKRATGGSWDPRPA